MSLQKDNNNSMFKKIVKHLLLMLAVSVAIIVIVFVGIRIFSRHGQSYELPDLIGQNIEALQHDNDLELRFIVLDSSYRDGVQGGTILTQDPSPAAKIKKRRKIYVTIAAYSPDDAIVPDLTSGVTLRTAISQLEGVGLRGGRLKFVDSPFRNNIIEMTYNGRVVNAGEKLTNGAKIDLVVGLGDDPSKAVSIVPFLIGKAADRVHREILSASFNIGSENFDGVKDRATAVVYKQEPSYTGVHQYNFGTRVNLWYCDADEQKIHKMVDEFRIDTTADNYSSEGFDNTFEDEGLDW